jgi:hypothetical protein
MLGIVTAIVAVAGVTTRTPVGARLSTQAGQAEMTGVYWRALSESAKVAYIRGFLAGVAAEQATGGLTTAAGTAQGMTDTAALVRSIAAMHAEHSLRFPFSASLYESQLDDFYWWEDHRSVPIVAALVSINGQLRTH